MKNSIAIRFNDATGIDDTTHSSPLMPHAPGWYTLKGTRLQGEPSKPGLYIHNGLKVVVK